MLVFASYLCFVTCVLGLIFSIYLLLRFHNHKSIYLLLALIFSLCWIEFYMFSLSSRNILKMPFLFRTAFPFRTILPVLLWLYIWHILNPKMPFKNIQLLHLVVPILITLGLIPDFVKPNYYKIEILNIFYERNNYLMQKNTGIFPAGFIQPFLLFYGLSYIIGSLIYIKNISKKYGSKFKNRNYLLLKWISLVTIVILIFILLQSIQYLSLLVKGDFSFFAQIGQSISLIFMKTYLLVNPNTVTNMNGIYEVEISDEEIIIDYDDILPKMKKSVEINTTYNLIEEFLNKKKGFINPNLSLDSMANELSFSKGKLSSSLQECFNMNFPEIINRYRIHHFIVMCKNDDTKLLKAEALILQCGYRNKTTFYLAFKKILKTNPKSFIRQLS